MLGRNIVVFEVLRLLERLLKHLVQRRCSRPAAPSRRCTFGSFASPHARRQQLLHRHANLLEHRRNHALFVLQQRRQQMQRQNLRIAVLRRQLAAPCTASCDFTVNLSHLIAITLSELRSGQLYSVIERPVR